MRRRYVYLAGLILLLWAGYYLFYRHRPVNNLPADTDAYAILDVKRLRNTVIWDLVSHPSRWGKLSLPAAEERYAPLLEQIRWPDYPQVFHLRGSAPDAWFSCLPLKDEAAFMRALAALSFRREQQLYTDDSTGIAFLPLKAHLLIATPGHGSRLPEIADRLFRKQERMNEQGLPLTTAGNDHLTLYLTGRKASLPELHLRCSPSGIRISGLCFAPEGVQLRSYPFHYTDTSICTLAFSQPDPGWDLLVPASVRQQWSQRLGFAADSLFSAGNLYYEFDLRGVERRRDTAVVYNYTESFEPVARKTIQETTEPVFEFAVQAPDATADFRRLLNNGYLTRDSTGYLFHPLPLVKTYASMLHIQKMVLRSHTYPAGALTHTRQGVVFGQLRPGKIPANWLRMLPDGLQHWLPRVERAELWLYYNDQSQLRLEVRVDKKRKEGMLLDW